MELKEVKFRVENRIGECFWLVLLEGDVLQ